MAPAHTNRRWNCWERTSCTDELGAKRTKADQYGFGGGRRLNIQLAPLRTFAHQCTTLIRVPHVEQRREVDVQRVRCHVPDQIQ
jgi:hypothetical protein